MFKLKENNHRHQNVLSTFQFELYGFVQAETFAGGRHYLILNYLQGSTMSVFVSL